MGAIYCTIMKSIITYRVEENGEKSYIYNFVYKDKF